MVATTLLPTVVHLIAGVGALIAHKSRMMHRVADDLEGLDGEPDPEDLRIAMNRLRWAHFWGYGTATFVVLIFGALLLWLEVWADLQLGLSAAA